MPEQDYEGYVRFRALVVTGNNVDWEEATPIEVKISSPTRRPKETTTSRPEKEDPTIEVDTTRWSHNHNHNHNDSAEDFSTLVSNEETLSSAVKARVTESYEMLEAEHGGWRKSKNGADHFHPKLKVYFFPIFTCYLNFYPINK